jgi:ribose 5-phosphate isomerase B
MVNSSIAIGCDHAGFELKELIKKKLIVDGFNVADFGTNSADSVDYPDYVHPVAKSIQNKENDFGILICGSANGVAITANKHTGIRAALCWKEEIASLARKHNDANIVCLPARFISNQEAEFIVKTFLNTAFEGGRHKSRIDKIDAGC